MINTNLSTGQTRVAPIETIVKKIKTPSIQYGLLDEQGTVAAYNVGVSNLNTQTPVDNSTQYALFSITKTLTAIAILQLQEKQLLNIDDLAEQYLPHYRFLSGISIRQLLSHQSGINNPLPLAWVHLATEVFDYQKFSHEILNTKAKNKRLPGQKSVYSNLNYLLLGEIIEKLTGQTFQYYIQTEVIWQIDTDNNLGFCWQTDQQAIGYHRQYTLTAGLLGLLTNKKKLTYKANRQWLAFRPCYVSGSAYGGIIANVQGMKAYLQALLQPGHPLLSDASKQLLFTEQSLVNGKPCGKSLGWFVGALNKQSYVCHAGGGGGFYAEARIYPESKKASFLLMNKSGFSDQRLLDRFDQATFNN